MPKVTALERQKRNKERVNVYLDGEFAFGLHELDAVKLHIGQILNGVEITELRERDAIHQAVERGIHLLSFRPRSIQEVRQRLARHDIAEDVIEVAIERLQSLGYLDDTAFARFWIENRTQFKPLGASALRYELGQKGIPREIAEPLIASVVDEFSAGLQVAVKKHRRYRGLSEREYQQKLGAFLQRRGFQYDTVRQVIEHLIATTKDEESDFFLNDEYIDEG